MIELNEDEALILAQARRALEPTSADEQRILQALLPQLTPMPSVPPGSSMPGSSWTTRAIGAIAVIGAIALSGGLGYRMGFEAGIDQKKQAASAAECPRRRAYLKRVIEICGLERQRNSVAPGAARLNLSPCQRRRAIAITTTPMAIRLPLIA